MKKWILLLTPLPSGSAHQAEKDFNMEKAAKVFKDVFGDASNEYFDLIQHLARSSTIGSREQWKRHAEAIRSELERSGKSFSVETASEDGTERIATRQSVAIAVNACLLMFNLEGACAGFPTTNGQSFADLDFLGI